ncbi:hypothetical protein ACF9IK_32780 [Kitasatospora hibisci]|uniref:hypothetical protein n=1 Tax=Kitasatospora hibisci TaxID=3369522 RepID=UPI0037547DC0
MTTWLKRRPALRKLALAASWLTALTLVSRFASGVVDPSPVPGCGGSLAGSYLRGVAVGAWLAARTCLFVAALLFAGGVVSAVAGALRGLLLSIGRRPW